MDTRPIWTASVGQWRANGDLVALHRSLIPALQSFLQHLDGHHRIESGQYFPMMRKIEPKIGAGIDLLDRDHDAIHETLEACSFQGGLAFHQAVTGNAPDVADKAARLSDLIELLRRRGIWKMRRISSSP